MIKLNFPSYYTKNRMKCWGDISEKKWLNYRWQLVNSIATTSEIRKLLPGYFMKNLRDPELSHHFSITPYFFCLINPDNPDDPVAKQVIPSDEEFAGSSVLCEDPFSEKRNSPVKGMIRRYSDRAVLLSTARCATYCRYCTRKWNWKSGADFNKSDFMKIMEYLKAEPEIREIILSGGEPFMLSDENIELMLKSLFAVKSVETVRIGTRILSFLPQRINPALLKILAGYRPVWILTHFNHPAEITPLTIRAIDRLIGSGVVILNQTVFLKGVNDDAAVLQSLFCSLQNLRIKPYYLFQCDPVQGTGHFTVPLEKGIAIMDELKKALGGVALPNFVVDTCDAGKVGAMDLFRKQKGL